MTSVGVTASFVCARASALNEEALGLSASFPKPNTLFGYTAADHRYWFRVMETCSDQRPIPQYSRSGGRKLSDRRVEDSELQAPINIASGKSHSKYRCPFQVRPDPGAYSRTGSVRYFARVKGDRGMPPLTRGEKRAQKSLRALLSSSSSPWLSETEPVDVEYGGYDFA
jgi:hypothetical protein